ncbi:carbohydrate ABC transporter permease [Shouchella clausii]|jgi:putative aldouronate transport system permease protein|nr:MULTISPECIES: carbohydrate ABC transporter permease [Shouchella]MCM3314105.1 carbohydrate ABC transporter permease [Psychrobacillus sp. MER TA 17]ALA52109.1 polysaccharide ABC transporter permease [Shouchella clausii]MBU3230445.1 carbohydrate ABC transporter permease [Shouchella clausii]MBU3262356.1 carbohydrate ABC transporter permease [Shouchella clausii]MBU3507329.1 carbohydrate ABC transporter permease [Shouchella clausii]
MHYRSRTYRIFSVFNIVFLLVLSAICIMPLIHILAVSFSAPAPANANLVRFWPVDFTVSAWEQTFGNQNFLRALWNGVFRTVLGTIISLVTITLAAYALSKEDREFKGRKMYMYALVFVMLFNGGLIPTYILVQNLGLINTIWALVLPGAVNVFNLILLLNFFRTGVPKSLEEAAFIDGAGHFQILFKIYLPISLPALATVGLFTMVGQWNSWFDGLIYLTDSTKYPLSTFLQTIIVQNDFSQLNVNPDEVKALSERTVRSAQIFIGALPIIIVYPFLQKYFVKGIVLGSVKE